LYRRPCRDCSQARCEGFCIDDHVEISLRLGARGLYRRPCRDCSQARCEDVLSTAKSRFLSGSARRCCSSVMSRFLSGLTRRWCATAKSRFLSGSARVARRSCRDFSQARREESVSRRPCRDFSQARRDEAVSRRPCRDFSQARREDPAAISTKNPPPRPEAKEPPSWADNSPGYVEYHAQS